MRLDVAACAAELGLTYVGPCAGGEIGAGYVLLPDGRRAVLTAGNPATVPMLDVARAAGIPAPRYHLVADIAATAGNASKTGNTGSADNAGTTDNTGTTVVVQELLPGRPPAAIDQTVLDGMLAVSARCTGLLRSSGLPQRELYLHRDGPGFCLHGSLAGYSARTAALLARVHAVPLDELPGDDLVHFDYHPGNVLTSADGTVTGVVDWDGAGRGTRAFDLVTLLFWLCRHAPDRAGQVHAAAAALAPPEILTACWAHMALRQVDWSIRHHAPTEVDAWLTVAERWLPATAPGELPVPGGSVRCVDDTTQTRQIAVAYIESLEHRDWSRLVTLLAEDVAYEVPQTRERIRGRSAFLQFNMEYPGDWHLRVRRVVADGSLAALWLDVRVGADGLDACVWVEVGEHGLIQRITDYWPEPYDPPPGREHLVERW